MIKIEPQDTILAFWFISYPPEAMGDMMGMIWRDGDSGKYFGEFRFRYYDPLDPGNAPFSGKDRKSWYSLQFDERPDLTDIKEMVMEVARRARGTVHWTEKERSGDEFEAYLMTCPWVHVQMVQ